MNRLFPDWEYGDPYVEPGPDWGTPEADEIMRSAAAEARAWLAMNEAYGRMLDNAADIDSPAYREAADEFATLKRAAQQRKAA